MTVRVSRGGVARLDGIYAGSDDALVDPVSPEVRVRNSLGALLATGVPVRDSVGRYHYQWPVPLDMALGIYTAEWTGVVDGQASSSTEDVEVTEVGMASTGDERIDELIAQTIVLITQEPTTVVLMRPPAAVSDGEGGSRRLVGADVEQPAQQFFVSGVTRDSDYRQSSFIVAEDGEKFVNRLVIIGLPGANIKQGDWFMFRGYRVEINYVEPDQRWQVKADGERVSDGGD